MLTIPDSRGRAAILGCAHGAILGTIAVIALKVSTIDSVTKLTHKIVRIL